MFNMNPWTALGIVIFCGVMLCVMLLTPLIDKMRDWVDWFTGR